MCSLKKYIIRYENVTDLEDFKIDIFFVIYLTKKFEFIPNKLNERGPMKNGKSTTGLVLPWKTYIFSKIDWFVWLQFVFFISNRFIND